MRSAVLLSGAFLALTCSASQTEAAERGLEAHLHGHGSLNIALEGETLWLELEAPGADIVGFEHPASSDQDKAAVAAAKDQLADPFALFTIPAAADCRLDEVAVDLEQSEAGGNENGHDHGEEDHDAHGHDEDGHDEEEDHADHGHDEEGHDDHDEHAEEEHGHDEHGHSDESGEEKHAEASHSAFHAEYLLTCAQPSAIDEIGFPYFDLFAGAEALDVSIVTDQGQGHFEVTREEPRLRLTDQ